MDAPEVRERQWIRVGKNDALILRVNSPGNLYIGYYQNQMKAIGEDVLWDGEKWIFKTDGVDGTYLRGADAEAVKRGPRDQS